MKIFFYFSGFIIFWAMIGYPTSLMIFDKFINFEKNLTSEDYTPSVTIMVVAHNEEKVILEKLNNICKLNYPSDKLRILVASDNSSDATNEIVRKFISDNSKINLELYITKKREGKTNAQNEAYSLIKSEYLVMTDANSMLEENAIINLMKYFTSDKIAYVCGNLVYINDEIKSAKSESVYWNFDKKMRDIESRAQTITAGNGALYAVRTKDYIITPNIYSHDFFFPLKFGLNQKRSIYAPDALVFEKAGEKNSDEFKRKVRMNRNILLNIIPTLKIFNIFKFKWFSYFYFGHRTTRYLLWLAHIIFFFSNCFLVQHSFFYIITWLLQIFCYITCLLVNKKIITNQVGQYIYYYSMTVAAQWVGVWNIISGKNKPFWDKAQSTR
ncbi:glycosyltransferase [Facklamia sp. P13064]|uniref:glycosyltransferase n=1 Tax=Facklamia sp. P13064 TaxID=3421953 RepID=UPI003D179EE7